MVRRLGAGGYTAAMTETTGLADALIIRDLLDGRWADVGNEAREPAKDPRFHVEPAEDTLT